MTETIIYEHNNATGTLEFPTMSASTVIKSHGKVVIWRADGTAVAHDLEQTSRTFTCTAKLTSTEFNSLKGWLMTAYGAYGTYPRMKFYLDSTTYWDDPNWIKCVIVGDVVGVSSTDSRWNVTLTFAERT